MILVCTDLGVLALDTASRTNRAYWLILIDRLQDLNLPRTFVPDRSDFSDQGGTDLPMSIGTSKLQFNCQSSVVERRPLRVHLSTNMPPDEWCYREPYAVHLENNICVTMSEPGVIAICQDFRATLKQKKPEESMTWLILRDLDAGPEEYFRQHDSLALRGNMLAWSTGYMIFTMNLQSLKANDEESAPSSETLHIDYFDVSENIRRTQPYSHVEQCPTLQLYHDSILFVKLLKLPAYEAVEEHVTSSVHLLDFSPSLTL